MPGGQKKAILQIQSGERHFGYLPAAGFVEHGTVEMLNIDGKTSQFLLKDIRRIAYVRDFNLGDTENPEGILRTTFAGRPRTPGLWIKLSFPDSAESFEGIADITLPALEALAQDGGLTLTPPDLRGNTQRIFFPHAALTGVEVLGWITVGKKPGPPRSATSSLSGNLFGDEA